MSLIDQIKQDIKDITSNSNDFGAQLVFVAPTLETATIFGLHSKHTMSQDTEGNRINSKNAHISFSEELLTELNYPTRNAAGEFTLIGHKVTVMDSTGLSPTYKISENYPDETIGLMVCILKDYTS